MKDSPEEEFIQDGIWDYTKFVRIDPCMCNQECGNYILSIKGEYVHMDNAPPDEFIDVCTIPNWMLLDIGKNCSEMVNLEYRKIELEKSIKKHP